MKIIFIAISFLASISVFSNEEMNIEINTKTQKIQILKKYVGEPVSRRRRLIIKQKCGSKFVEIYNDKYCDFTNFKYDELKVSFMAKYYNPDTGECTSPKTREFSLILEKKCK